MNWSDNEENNDTLNQPNRDLPDSESSEEDENNDYYNIIYKKHSTSILDCNKEDSIKKPKPKNKNSKVKYIPIFLPEKLQNNNRKFNPRLPPPNKK
jgi:hypothetical protein